MLPQPGRDVNPNSLNFITKKPDYFLYTPYKTGERRAKNQKVNIILPVENGKKPVTALKRAESII